MAHHNGVGKEESESKNLTEQRKQYKGPITHSRVKLVNLIAYLDCMEECEVPEAVGVDSVIDYKK